MRLIRIRFGVLLLILALVATSLVALAGYSWLELARFRRGEVERASLIYSAPQPLRRGMHVGRVDLAGTLARLQYRETPVAPSAPGEFRRLGSGWDIFLREVSRGAGQPAQRVQIDVHDDRISRIARDGRSSGPLVLEPEVLTGADDVPGEEVRPVRLAEVPVSLRNAVLAAEDHRFQEHGGLDPRGLARAFWVNLRSARVVQGGSTITQQLVKSRLLGRDRTAGRKLREAWLATLVEWRYSKDEILEAYLNEIYLGHRGGIGVRGVGAAARVYFGREVHQLTLAESALVAAMIRAPNRTSPVLDAARAREGRDSVLARMRELGMITIGEYERSRAEPVRAKLEAPSGQVASCFTDLVRREVEGRVEGAFAGRTAVHIATTLDLSLQRFAEAAVARGLDRLETRRPSLRAADPAERLQAALVALDPETGEIRAMVGGRDYRASQFNRAVFASRQPGSAFKPFVFAAALRPRVKRAPAFTAASFVDDSPLVLTVDGQPWRPRNFEGRNEGRVTVRRALEGSLNAATVRIARTVGLPAVVSTAKALGLRAAMAPVPAAALGAFEVTPLDLARAYLPFANGGRRFDTSAVSVIQDANGLTLWSSADAGTPVLSTAEAYLMTSLLQGAVRSGTAAGLVTLPVPAAGKTGTTNEGRDAWFVGYTQNLVALVWVGFDSGRAHGMSGAQAAVPIWVDFMRQALDAYPARDFPVPPGVAIADIDPTNGRRALETCPLRVREVFLAGTEPPLCEEHVGVPERLRRWLWQPMVDWFRR